MKNEFKTITVNPGDNQAYIGINFAVDRTLGNVRATMGRYIQEILESGSSVRGSARTPADSELFYVNEESPLASDLERTEFHSSVAKLLYLAKRVRPDLLTTISFLATRVREPTQQDLQKLERIVRYIRATPDLGIELSMNSNQFDAYVDASHAVHSRDGKSQTGLFVTLGSGPFFVRSSKQKLVSKSSTEAELVAISDSLPALIWMRNLLIEQGMISANVPITLHEDNQSTLALVKRGRPSGESSRHIAIRHFFVSDRCKSGEINMIYEKSEDQIADYFTKALLGATFLYLRAKLVLSITTSIT